MTVPGPGDYYDDTLVWPRSAAVAEDCRHDEDPPFCGGCPRGSAQALGLVLAGIAGAVVGSALTAAAFWLFS